MSFITNKSNYIKKIKKIFFILLFILFFFLSLKLIDMSLAYLTGLGKPVIYNYSSIYGYEIKKNQETKRKGKIIKINNMGMRSNHEWKGTESYKILFMGDSVTYGGAAVSNAEIFSEKTCEKIKKEKNDNFICGNLGTNGYGIEAISKRIKYKSFQDENLIIIVLIGNDFDRGLNHLAMQPFWSSEINNFYPAITDLIMIYMDKLRISIRFPNISEIKDSKKIQEKYYLESIKEFKKNLIENKKNYLIVYSPEKQEFDNPKKYFFIKSILKKNFNDFIDISESKLIKKDEIYIDHVHLNKEGHEIYATIIYDYIKKKYLK